MSKIEPGLKYTRTDEWLRVEGKEGVVGLTDYAQEALNDIVYVELPAVGDTFGQDDSFGTVESVKAASDLHIPAGGTVTAVNEALEDAPETINGSPYGDGWLIKVALSDPVELDNLMDADAYAKYCAERDQE
jgi:glycine cleavage system H protein